MNMREIMALVESPEPTIEWTVPKSRRRSYESGEEVVVQIDVAKLDASWSKDYVYVAQGGAGATRKRYPEFGEWLERTNDRVEMPEVCISAQGWISFNNGRHRFAWLRDHGLKTMPVLVPVGDAVEIRQNFGV